MTFGMSLILNSSREKLHLVHFVFFGFFGLRVALKAKKKTVSVKTYKKQAISRGV